MDWLLAMTYGAIGGAVVEAVVSSDRVLTWNAARHQALRRTPATPVPALTAYLDPVSNIVAGLTRILLGAVAGGLFHAQVTGAYAAIAVGCAAPTVLRQLGSTRWSFAGSLAKSAEESEQPKESDERERTATVEPVTEAEPVLEPQHSTTAEEHA